MLRNNKRVGSGYEKLAADYLTARGYEIVEMNFRCRTGEIDIIAREGRYLVFVEVKYRNGRGIGTPLEAVTPGKQRSISRVAVYYMLVRHLPETTPCRFDVVGISPDGIELVRNAFSYCG